MTQERRQEVVELVARSPHTVGATVAELGVSKSSFYRWRAQLESGRTRPEKKAAWNALLPEERQIVLEQALAQPHLSARELAFWLCDHANVSVSEATVRRLLKTHGLLPQRAPEQEPAAKEWRHKTTRINEIWQSDATRFLIPGWGHYWLVSVLDDYSRRILAWEQVEDVQTPSLAHVIQLALEATGLAQAPPVQKPALLTDNGSGYISQVMEACLRSHEMRHIRARPHHPQTTGTSAYRPTPLTLLPLEREPAKPDDCWLYRPFASRALACPAERYHSRCWSPQSQRDGLNAVPQARMATGVSRGSGTDRARGAEDTSRRIPPRFDHTTRSTVGGVPSETTA